MTPNARPSSTKTRGLLRNTYRPSRPDETGQRRSQEDFGSEALVDFTGDPDSWIDAIGHWEKSGGTRIALRAMDTAAEFAGEKFHGYAGPQSYIDALETFMQEVGSLKADQ